MLGGFLERRIPGENGTYLFARLVENTLTPKKRETSKRGEFNSGEGKNGEDKSQGFRRVSGKIRIPAKKWKWKLPLETQPSGEPKAESRRAVSFMPIGLKMRCRNSLSRGRPDTTCTRSNAQRVGLQEFLHQNHGKQRSSKDPYKKTPKHCNLQIVVSNFILVLKKQHVSNGCKMYLLRSPVKGLGCRNFCKTTYSEGFGAT